MSTRSDYIGEMASWIQDRGAKLASADLARAVNKAAERYSRDRPLTSYSKLSGTGSVYEFSVPTGWVRDYSRLKRVEYPYPPATGQRDPNVVFDEQLRNEGEAVIVVRLIDGTDKIRFMLDTPVLGTDNIALAFTIPHTVDDASSTVPSYDERAFVTLCAHYACEMLAAFYSQAKDAAFSVDTADWKNKADHYRTQAKESLAIYLDHIKAQRQGAAEPASATADWDCRTLFGYERLFRRTRIM